MAGGALRSSESFHKRRSKVRLNSGGEINQNCHQPASWKQQAEQRSCPKVVVLKVALRAAKLQEVPRSADRAIRRRQLLGRHGRKEGCSSSQMGIF